jgi:hypothetical protein
MKVTMNRVFILYLIITTLLSACSETQTTKKPQPSSPASTSSSPSSQYSSDTDRELLTYTDLMDDFESGSPIDEHALALPFDASPPLHVFEGRLELFSEDLSGEIQMVKGSLPPEASHLPEFDYQFVQYDTHLVPVQRGLVITEHPDWNYILEPGRVWSENGDQGYSRVSFPFGLVYKGSNAILNGTMAFLFNDDSISKVWYQITQETTVSTQANLWGLLEAEYHPAEVKNVEEIRSAFAQELADRFPTKPFAELAYDYPGVDLSAFASGVNPADMTWYGLVVNGINYVSDCPTRFGNYPYCGSMRAASYSVAKSSFVSVALMRLAQIYGTEVADLLIKDYVPEYRDSPGNWEHVTFNHTIDMATGNYISDGYMVDEDGPQMNEFFEAQPYDRRIALAFNWPNATAPGTQWNYRTCDTFILTRALSNYLGTQLGPEADIFEFVVDEVYIPLKIDPGAHTTMRTADDNWQGEPEGGYGLWWTQDGIAKIASLLNNQNGMIEGQQVLHPDLLASALQHNPDDRGVVIRQGQNYNNAFWATHYTEGDGYDCSFWVTQMLGISGNVVALMPNGITYYYFSDSHDFTWDMAVREADKITPLCP